MSETWRQLVQAYPFLQSLWEALAIIIPLSALTAYAGALFISATAKIIYVSRARVAYDKCSRQVAFLGLALGWLLLVGGRVWLYLAPAPAGSVSGFVLEMSWLLLSLGVLLTTVYYTMWGILKNMPVLHVTLGMIAAAQNCVALVAILFALRLSGASAAALSLEEPLPELFPSVWSDPVWSAACFTIPLIFGMAGALAAFWLAARRKNHDYGRDFYNTMLPWCAAWARNSWIILWLMFVAASGIQIWLGWRQGALDTQVCLYEGIRAALWLIPPVLWQIIIRSPVPMRHKWALSAALIFAATFMLPYFRNITLM